MRAVLTAAVLAGVWSWSPVLGGVAEDEGPAVVAETTLGELLTNTARAEGLAILYDADLAGQRVALANAPAGATARALLEQALQLRGLRLDVDGARRVARIVALGRSEAAWPIVYRSGAAGPPAPAEGLVSRVVRLRHADATQVAQALRGYARDRHEFVGAVRGASEAVVLNVRGDRLAVLEAIIADLDQPAARGDVAEVVRVVHGHAAELAGLLARMCSGSQEELRAEPGPTGGTIALVGPAARVAQAKALLAGLDVPEGR